MRSNIEHSRVRYKYIWTRSRLCSPSVNHERSPRVPERRRGPLTLDREHGRGEHKGTRREHEYECMYTDQNEWIRTRAHERKAGRETGYAAMPVDRTHTHTYRHMHAHTRVQKRVCEHRAG